MYNTLVMQEDMNTSKAFVTLSVLELLSGPLLGFPNHVMNTIQVFVSLKRLQNFFDSKSWKPLPQSPLISLENCTFCYENKEILKNISLNVKEGEFLAVIGAVGSGKSSLLMGLMGEIVLKTGKISMNANVSYAPSQDAWLLNASLKENILLGREYEETWYNKVVNACCLLPDINALPAGDSTEIGERGINLSGGQKARICLARAVYTKSEVYLLDDPLSSVDNHVAAHIVEHCLLGLLKGKTRILVTHRYNCLDKVDRVVEIKNNNICEVSSINRIETENPDIKEPTAGVNKTENTDKLIEEEETEVGEVNRQVFLDYFKYSGSYIWIVLGVSFMILLQCTLVVSDISIKD